MRFFAFISLFVVLAACAGESTPQTPTADVVAIDASPDVVVDASPPECPLGRLRCGASCVEVQTSNTHCGACGSPCAAGRVCEEGRCAVLCAAGQTRCAGAAGAEAACVTTASDPAHCGACGNGCAAGQTCVMGACRATCEAGAVACLVDAATRCVNTAADALHCGACGVACAASESCAMGRCGVTCAAGQTACGGRCVDTAVDGAHCGACDRACPGGQSCVTGACRVSCGAGQSACGAAGAEACVTTASDSDHCGRCGNACPAGQRCSAGACGATCAAGTTACSDGAGTSCADLTRDAAHCGRCGGACAAGESCVAGRCELACAAGQAPCGGRCVTTASDSAHCGACGNACAAGRSCVAGRCELVCPAGQTACGGGCVDVSTDGAHCGACGVACAAGQRCAAGACRAICDAGTTACTVAGATRCVDVAADPAHCGACGATCAAGQSCVAGACELVCPGDRRACAGACVDATSDTAHCGACGNACGAGQSCISGRCMLVCAPGRTACAGACVDTAVDALHCGACGSACGGAPCVAGRCMVSAPVAAASAAPARIARDDNFRTLVTLDASASTGGGVTYQWVVPDARFEAGSSATDAVIRVRFSGASDHAYMVRVRNAGGESAASGVVRINRAPVAVPGTGASVRVGTPFAFDGSASSDADGDALTFRWTLPVRPAGSSAALGAAATARPTLTPDVTGAYLAELVVNDGFVDSAPARVTVQGTSLDETRPAVTVTVSPASAAVGTAFAVCVVATDASPVASRRLSIAGTATTLDAAGCARFTGAAAGRFEAEGFAVDAAGNEGRGRNAVFVRAAVANAAPTVAITAPDDATFVAAPTDVVGTVSDDDLALWWLEATPHDRTEYTAFARGTSTVAAARVATLDPGAFTPGMYRYRLCAEDTFGNRTCTAARAVEFATGSVRPGVVRVAYLDAQVDVGGLSLAVRRVYDSRYRAMGDFGYGWTMEVEQAGSFSQLNSPAEGFQESGGCLRLPFRPSIRETIPHRWSTTIGGRTFRFRQTVTGTACGGGFAQVNIAFTPEAGTAATLTPLGVATTNLWLLTGDSIIYNDDLSEWDPTRWRLAVTGGNAYELTRGAGVTAVIEPSGNRIDISPTGIRDGAGAALTIARAADGRITAMTLPDGRVRTYRVDSVRDLVATTDFTAAETRYQYNLDHLLVRTIDPRGATPGTIEYDSEGRIAAVVDASGQRATVRYEPGNRVTTTDRMGNVTLVTHDARGNVTSRVDALGNETRYSYDSAGRVLSETNALGHAVRFEYDASGNMTAVVDPLGNRSVMTYDARGNLLSFADPTGVTERSEFDASNAVTATVSPFGGRTTLTYDASGRPTSIALPGGATARAGYDSRGRLSTFTTPTGQTETLTYRADGQVARDAWTHAGRTVATDYTYDARGRWTGEQYPDGARSTVAYGADARIEAVTLRDGTQQRVTYDERGQERGLRMPDGNWLSLARDREDRVTDVATPAGGTLERTLDALGRPTTVRYPHGTYATVTYDRGGRIATRAANGVTPTAYTWDAASRLTQSVGPDGAVTRYEYDAAGRRTAAVDALGNRTELTYGTGGALRLVRFPGGATSAMTVDSMGRTTSMTDERGASVSWERDAVSRLTAAVDASGGRTVYAYGDSGRLTGVTTPAGNTWAFTHTADGERLTTRSPWGGSASWTRDPSGRATRFTNAAGQTVDFTYDAEGRVTRRVRSDVATAEEYTFGPQGKMATARGPWGLASLSYDAQGRLRNETLRDGVFVESEYDAAGRRVAVRTASGTTRYTYDAVTGRLASVDDTLAGRTAWTYDLVGRVATVSHPDGATTTYTRDGRGRISRERVARGAAALRDVTYTRDPAGNITRAAEASGRAVDYTYDAGGRIAREVRAGGADDASTDYGYDADGALTRMGARTLAVSQTRLTSDGATAYTWDAAGRLASRASGARGETFRYDAHGRVVEVTRTGATPARVELAYDHEGLLTRVAADGVGRNLLWDHAGVVAQLLEERDDMGALLARYVQAGGPVAMAVGAAAGSARAIHRDATGSVRVVTDATGAVRESLAYDAWGSATAGASAETRVRHRGEYYVPELGLTYLRARFYDPAIGRFLTPDPIEGTQEAPLSFNPYQFAGNNPVTYGDLTGGFSMASVSVSVAIVSTLASIAIPMIPGAMDVVFGPLLPEVGGFRLNGANAGVSWSQGIADIGIGVDLAFAPGHTVFVVSAVFGLALRSGSSAGVKFSWSGGPSLNADMTTDTAGFLLSFSGSWARRFVDWIRNSSRVRGRNARWTAAVTYLEYAAAFSIKLGEANAHGTANFESTVRISLGFESFGAPSAGDGGGSVGPFVRKTVLKRLNSGAWPTNKFGGSVGFQLQVPVFAMHWYDGVLNDDYWPLDDIFMF